ncbi:tRNA lysidine(34) synthetase TilS [Sulfitobacter sp. F26169L]|uniref:tRNA lysidine(34) synthetase TilS n=1 Tax=Sulfitobacter sp. F26169L TaxID=2996015 RepID=UPI0022609064|nr:tRNA lysidine(34) synthetase TilS [Sulfitobacter sp. F26169L]MCX7567578.1 tRNA lysidine(34) synthetase TilS [Sulfitobacter sp. F26169L]
MRLDQNWVQQQGADCALLQAVDAAFQNDLPGRIGIAVSGGGDSMALLHLFARWSVQTGHPIAAVTVDHGLRPESRAEADGVAQMCRSLAVPHDILTWEKPKGAGNLAAAARDGRYTLMAHWASQRGIGGISLGHTLDDSAENFIMRLGRAAGVDGLSEMERCFQRESVLFARPLGQHRREDLRKYLVRHEIHWVEDPSNDDPRYTRTKARRVLPALAEIGVTPGSIQHTATALRQAQSALAHYTRVEAERHVTQQAGDLLFPLSMLQTVPEDIRRRLWGAALQWVGSRAYPPRKFSVRDLECELHRKQRVTLSGCVIMKRQHHLRITREYNAVKNTCTPTGALWDSRWALNGPHAHDLSIRALGGAVNDIPDWRETGVPRRSLMASPAVWRGETPVAVPLAGYNRDWTAQIVADFASFLLSH